MSRAASSLLLNSWGTRGSAVSKIMCIALCSLQGATDIHFLFDVYINSWTAMKIHPHVTDKEMETQEVSEATFPMSHGQ